MVSIPLHTLLYTIVILLFALLIFFSSLIRIKQQRLKTSQKQVIWIKEHEEYLFNLLSTGEWRIRANLSKQFIYEAIEQFFLNFLKTVNDPESQRHIQQWVETHFAERYRKQLNNRSMAIRLNTLYRIERFHCTSFQAPLYHRYLLNQMTTEEKILTLQILSKFQDERVIELLNKEGVEYPDFYYSDILTRLSTNIVTNKVIDCFQDLTPPLQYAAIEYIGAQGWNEYEPLLLKLIDHNNQEMNIRAMKALYQLHYVSDMTSLLPHFETDHWPKKMWLAKLSMLHHHETCIPYLKQWLADSSWYVRRAAANALLSYPTGEFELRQIAQFSEDAYARDAAKERLERGIGF
ncbi:HEAT repeat domain-containing protein [Bacillus sp. FJAT-42315]|uniref:HEAT repeat domain-containing protein n=1 Tax=Bacillus sp. FJAT-42315 TaxID=2014077 RepID=UPI000C237A7F|nr:HEAT repeat domain-containing protein [Bacillus sp. FJAT-42315]